MSERKCRQCQSLKSRLAVGEHTAPVLSFEWQSFRVSVQFDRYTFDKPHFIWEFADVSKASEPVIYANGDDLALGTDDYPTLLKALSVLADFLGAWIEAKEYEGRTGKESENANLFPESLWEVIENASGWWHEFSTAVEIAT